MPCRPVPMPFAFGSKPTPSSRTSKLKYPSPLSSRTVTAPAPEYFAAFWTASRQEKYTAASISCG